MRAATAKVALIYEVYFGLAYRQPTVKATSGGLFAAKLRSGKRDAGVIVLLLVIG
ncbi:MAG: hypothetical protein WB686_24590 [Pseudolabrys sp.]